MEGRLVTRTFERLFAQSGIDPEEMESIKQALLFAEELFDGLGFCVSEKPDLLSQWRGYADDGQGFSIGFSKNYLEELANVKEEGEPSFIMGKVLYSEVEHEAALRPTYEEIKELIDSGKLKTPSSRAGLLGLINPEHMQKLNEEHANSVKQMWLKALKTYRTVYMLKNTAFSEEAEWRLVSYLSKEGLDSALYRASGNRLIPYREFQLKPLVNKSITNVYIGPKNITPIHVVEKFLSLNGFPEVSVKRSVATYR